MWRVQVFKKEHQLAAAKSKVVKLHQRNVKKAIEREGTRGVYLGGELGGPRRPEADRHLDPVLLRTSIRVR